MKKLKYLSFDPPAPRQEVALEGIVGDTLKKLGGLFKSRNKKLDLQKRPIYESEIKALKTKVLDAYGTLGQVQKFELVGEGQTVSAHNIASILGTSEQQPTPIHLHKDITQDIAQMTSYRPRLETAVRNFFTDGNRIVMHADSLARQGLLNPQSFKHEVDAPLLKLCQHFTMPAIPSGSHFQNIIQEPGIRGSFDPCDADWSIDYAKLKPEALHRDLQEALPALTHDQIVDFGHAMVEILNFLLWDVSLSFQPAPPYLGEGEPEHLHAYLDGEGFENHPDLQLYSSCLYQGHFIPEVVWMELTEFMGDCLLALDRWISRSIK